ncbi:two-component sensor histidine kinase [Streptomyces camponoticapitis]|uniref:histidine kinase n=1 Tax=Streptomyces camponoticapitis TaxID=1616125 RepID=A0ABQ2EEE4_9ACTN|nr:histidine kinase [Streptomyces camponoticapitis]GGK05727.1 two-component sensor histidine kinase [Streptomyces camponoticapitis]
MPIGAGTAWPSREALTRVGVPPIRTALDYLLAGAMACWLVVTAYAADVFHGWQAVLPVLGLLCFVAAVLLFYRWTVAGRLLPSLGLLLLVALLGVGADAAGAEATAGLLWILGAVLAMDRLPLAPALGVWTALFVTVAVANSEGLPAVVATMSAVLLGGYTLRLDAQAHAAGFRLLAEERAARAAEAESAALAERARIAREIHDVLAHSLSAQLVHLEAARLQIEGGYDREQVLRRVVEARGMARQGLAETRQALSALRGQMVPVEDYLRELAVDGVRTEVVGEPRLLPVEASQAVRRVAQEAVTNARKHAPGADVTMRLEYGEGVVTLEVRDDGTDVAGSELAASGSGFGLLGMRERAELLGGSLEAGPSASVGGGAGARDSASGGDSGGGDANGSARRTRSEGAGEGFTVRLRVPA